MKKIITKILCFFAGTVLFAQSVEYRAFLEKAKQFETQKKWCHALDAYYDALGTDDEPELKEEAWKGFSELKSAILSGKPGLGNYNAFTLHDEWKKLLIDAEQVGCSFSRYEITLGDLKQSDLDYVTKTASYTSEVSYKDSGRYKNTVSVVEIGYSVAYKDDWSIDLPKSWPYFSVSFEKNKSYNVNGALVFERSCTGDYGEIFEGYINPFAYFDDDRAVYFMYQTAGLFDYKFNIIDETGKELVKGNRWLLGQSESILIKEVPSDVMDLIDSGKAFINPVACYLEYGKINENDVFNENKRAFIKNFPEVRLPIEKCVFICNNSSDKKGNNMKECEFYFKTKAVNKILLNFVEIPGRDWKMLDTEVTQELYETVMGSNPSKFEKKNNPVENVSLYKAIYFCNLLSRMKNLEPVYKDIDGEITQNIMANGFRIPTEEEWQYAAKGGQDYAYAGSPNLDEVGWYEGNSEGKTHSVAQKKANAYGLFDMNGNVGEWTWTTDYKYSSHLCGGSWKTYSGHCSIGSYSKLEYDNIDDDTGFRIIVPNN